MDVDAAMATTSVRHELVPQLRFPPGYRFVPTEEELVDVYLRAKIEGRQLLLQVVNDVDILNWQPGRLVEEYKGYGENRWFFFTVREQSSSNKEKEPSRKVKVPGVTATWKATGSVQLIRARSKDAGDSENNKVVVGSKRVLIYSSSDAEENGKWSMHEYILKGHAQIGQYALYSIQRKQHSDTEDKAGDDDDMGSEKKTNKRKRREKPCTEPEGVQLPHPETTGLLAEPPLKPTRKAKAQRKKRPSIMQVGVEGEQQQQGKLPMGPVTPPKKDERTLQQERRQQTPPPAEDGALQVLRACPPSDPNGTLGAPAPMIEEVTLDDMAQLWAFAMLYNNQGQQQWAPSLTGSTTFHATPDTTDVVDLAPFHPYQQKEDGYNLFDVQNQYLTSGQNQSVYMEPRWQHADDRMFLMENTTTQPINMGGGWEHGDDQRHQIHHLLQQENNGGGFGVVEDQQPMNHHPQGGHDLPPSDEQSSGSEDLQVDSLLFGESGFQMDELHAFVSGVLVSPQDLAAGTQEKEEGDDPATLQAAGMPPEQCFYYWQGWQVQRAGYKHVPDAPNEPCSCIVCASGGP